MAKEVAARASLNSPLILAFEKANVRGLSNVRERMEAFRRIAREVLLHEVSAEHARALIGIGKRKIADGTPFEKLALEQAVEEYIKATWPLQ